MARRKRGLSRFILSSAFALCLPQAIQAATLIWDSDLGTADAQDGGGAWSLGGATFWNGTSNVATTSDLSTDIAQFGNGGALGAPATVNVATQSIRGLIFGATSGSGYSLTNTAASTLTIGPAGIVVNSGAQATSIGSAAASGLTLALGAAASFVNDSSSLLTLGGTVDNGGFLLTIDGAGNITTSATTGIISGAGGLTKNGAGTLTINATNTYSGATTINGGSVVVAAGKANGTGALTINSGGTLQVNAGTDAIDNTGLVTVNAGGVLRLNGGATETVARLAGAGTIERNLAGTTTLSVSSTTSGTFSGVIQNPLGTLALTKTNTNTVTLSGLTNTYTGVTTINRGVLTVAALANAGVASSIGAPTGTAADITFNNSSASQTSGLTYSGTTPATTDRAISITLGSGAITTAHTITISNASTTAGASLVFTSNLKNTTNTAALAPSLIFAGTNPVADVNEFRGNLINSTATGNKLLNVSKAGTNVWKLSGTNTYTGTTTITAGTLQFGKEVSLYNNTPASWTATNIVVSSAATMALNVGGTGEFTSSDVGTLAGLGTATGGFLSGSILALDTTNAAGSFTLSAAIANPFAGANILGLTKLGSNTLQLTGANSYTGPTTISAGTLQTAGAGKIGNSATTITSGTLDVGSTAQSITTLTMGGGAAGTTAAVTIGAGGVLTLGGNVTYSATNNPNGATISGSGALDLGGATRTFTVGNSTAAAVDLQIDAVIQGAGAGVTKATAGSVLLLNGANTFTGPVTVSGGELQFNTVSDNGGPASNLGQGTDGLSIGVGTLSFVGGTSQSTNRGITATGGTGSSTTGSATTLGANGTNNAVITYNGAIAAGANYVILSGNSTSSGVIAGGITQSGTTADIYVNSGTWTLSGAPNTSGDDTIVTGVGTVLNLNTTGVLQGLSGNASNGLYSRNGAVINLNANEAYSTASGLDFILLADGTGAIATLNTNTFTISTPRLDLGDDSTNGEGSVIGSGLITVGTNLNLYRGSVNAPLTGAAALVKHGPGTVTLSSDTSGLTGATALTRGALVLDDTTSNTEKLGDAAIVTAQGGTLTLNGNTSASSAETLGGLTLGVGSSRLNVNNGTGQTATLSLGPITRAVTASAVNFSVSSGNAVIQTTSTNGAGSILGGYALFNSNKFATISGGQVLGFNSTVKDSLASWTAGDDVTDSTGYTGSLGSLSINSLRFDAAGATSTVNLSSGSRLTVSSGGILITPNVGTGTASITGGSVGSGSGELIVHQYNPTTAFTFGSSLAGGLILTKSGPGTLLLNGTNHANGQVNLVEGTLTLGGGRAINDYGLVLLKDESVLLDLANGTETIGGLTTNGALSSTGFAAGTVAIGSGTLTLNNASGSTRVFQGSLTGNGTFIKTGTNTQAFYGDMTGYTGTMVINQGLIDLSEGSLLNQVPTFVLNAGELLSDQELTSSVDHIGNSATVTLNNTAAVRGLWARNADQTSGRSETIGQVILGAGHNVIQVDQNGASGAVGRTMTLTSASLARNNHSTLLVRGQSLGQSSTDRGQLIFTAAPAGAVGGGGIAGTTTMNIVPYILGESTITTDGTLSDNFGNSFVFNTGTTNGLRPLTTAEYVTDEAGYNAMTGATTNNVRFATNPAAALTGAATAINSLVIDSNSTTAATISLTGPASSLEITSGAILAANTGTYSIGGFTGLSNAGGRDYIVYVPVAASSLTLNSPLTTATPLVKAGAGTLVLTTTNAITDVYFNQGLIRVDDVPKLGTGNLNFFGGGLQWATGATFDPSSRTITLGTGGGTFDTNSNNITFANAIGNGGAGNLTKAGAGILTLNAPVNFTGGAIVSAGTLKYGVDAALPVTTGLTLSGGTLDIDTRVTTLAGLSVQGNSTISGSANLTFNGDSQFGGGSRTLTINNSGVTSLTGSVLTLVDSGTTARTQTIAGTGATIITSDIIDGTAAGSLTITNSNVTTLSGVGFYTGTTNMNAAAGTLVMSGRNRAAGPVTLTTGTIQLDNPVNGGIATGLLTLTAGTLQAINAPRSISNNIALTAVTVSGTQDLTMSGTLTGVTGGSRTLTSSITGGTLTLGDVAISPDTSSARTFTVAGTGATTINGVISNGNGTTNNALSISNTGVTTLAGANTYSGTTTMNAAAGTLVLSGSNSGGGATTLTTGTIQLNSAANGGLASGVLTLTAGTLQAVNAPRTISNNVTLTAITISGTQNLTIGGTLTETSGASRTLTSSITGGQLTLGDVSISADTSAARTLTIAGTGATTINGVISNGNGTTNNNLTVTNTNVTALTGANTYSGNTTLNAAAGTLVLSGSNSSAGNTILTTGTLQLNSAVNGGLASGSLTLTAGTLQALNAARSITNSVILTAGTISGSQDLSIGGTLTGATGGDRTLDSGITGGTLTLGDIAISPDTSAARTFTIAGAGATTINGVISNGNATTNNNLTITNSNVTTLNAAATYSGNTTVSNGTLKLGASNVLPDGAGAGNVSVASGATIDLNGKSEAINGLSGAGTITSTASGGMTLSVGGVNSTSTFGGALSNGAGTLNLTKTGNGDLMLTGSSSYAGATTVNGGRLYIDATGALPATTSALSLADGTEFHIRATNPSANVVYGFSGTGNVVTIGSTTGALLGFGLDGTFNTQLKLTAGQTMTVNGTLTTAVRVNNPPTAGQDYILIDGADANSLHAGIGTFDLNPVVFNGGSFIYALRRDTLGGTVDRWVLTPTAQPALADVWWKGDLSGIGAGVWSASTTSGPGFPTNWDADQTTGTDALVPPDSGSIVHFSANGASNFATTLGANVTVQELIFHAGSTAISVDGVHALTLGNTVDSSGLTLQTGAPDVSFGAAVNIAQTQAWNVADGTSVLRLTGGIGGTGSLTINGNGASTGTVKIGGTGVATYTGNTSVGAGRLVLEGGASNRLPSAGKLTMGGASTGAVLQLGDGTGASNTAINSLDSGAATSNAIVGGASTVSTLAITQSTAGTFNGSIGGAGANENNVAITKQGPATLVLNGANTYTGVTTVNNGTLQLGIAASLSGTTALNLTANAGSTAVFDINGRNATLAGALTLGGGDATSLVRIDDTALGGLLTLGGNVTFNGTNNPLGAVINANLSNGAAARTFTANDSTNAAVDLTLVGTFASSAGATLDGTGVGAINAAWTLTGTNLALTKNGTGTWNINAATNTTGTGDWNINTGTIFANVDNALNAADDVILDGTGVQDSVIVIVGGSAGGLGIHQGDGVYVRNGGHLIVNVDNGISIGTASLNVGDNASGSVAAAGLLELNANINVNSGGLVVGATGGQIGNIIGTGVINTTGTFALRNGSIGSGITFANSGAITKSSEGTLTFAGTRSSTGATNIQEGNLILDYTSNIASKIGGVLTMGAATTGRGMLTLNGNATAPVTQTVGNLSVIGSSAIDLSSAGQDVVLQITGTLARTAGALDFNLPNANTRLEYTGATANTNGLIGGWATINGTDFVTIEENGAVDNLRAATYTTQNNASLWTAGANITNSGALSGSVGTASINSLRFNAANASTLTIGGVLTLSSGGLLVTPAVGANNTTITGGTLASGLANGELIIHQHNTAGLLTLASPVSGFVPITKTGPGTLVLPSANQVGNVIVEEGILRVSGGQALSDVATLLLRNTPTAGLELVAGQSETVGPLSAAGTSPVLILNTGSALTLNQTTAGTMGGQISGAGSLIKNGAAVLTLTGASNATFTGPIVVNQGQILLNGATARIGSTSITLNGGEFQDVQDQNGVNVDRLASNAAVTLNNTAGTNGFFLSVSDDATRLEALGAFTVGAGHNVITSFGSVTNAIADLSGTTLTRTGATHGTLLVRGNSLGASSGTRGIIRFSTAPGGAVGGGGAAGATNINIYPHIVGDVSETGVGNSFVMNTGNTNGLRPLTTAEYITDEAGYNALTGAATNNVRFATNPGAALTGTATAINSLVLDATTGITLTGPASSLEITSGAILAANTGSHSIGGFTGLTSAGGRDYIVYVTNAAGGLTFNTPLTTAVPLVKSGAGTLTLNATGNTFTDLYFNQGVVVADGLNKFGSGNLNFFGGTLRFGAQFDPSSKTITFGTGGGTFDTNGFDITPANPIGNAGGGSLTKAGAGALTLNLANTYTGGTVLNAGTLNVGHASALGTGALTLSGGTLDNTSGGALTLAGSAARNFTGSFTFTGSNDLNLGPGTVTLGASVTVTTTAGTLTVGGIQDGVTAFGLTKAGTGALTINGASSYRGATVIQAGTVNAGTNNAISPFSALTVGSGTTAGTLHLQTFDQTVTALNATANTASASSIVVGTGKTLTVNGNVSLNNNTNGAITNLAMTGGGSLVVNGASFTVGNNTAGTNNSSRANLDLSGLSSFTANLTGALTVQLTGDNGTGNLSSLVLANTANTITAATFAVGASATSGVQSLVLGAGTNSLNANTFNFGTGARDGSNVSFGSNPTGTLTLRSATGGRAAMNIGTGTATTGVAGSNTIDFGTHTVDLLLSNLTIGNQFRNGAHTNAFFFGAGVLDATTVQLGFLPVSGGTQASQTHASTINLSGGAVTIGTGGLELGNSVAANTGSPKTINATVNISGGTVTIADSATLGGAIRLVNNTGTANVNNINALINLTGGSLTVGGNIVKGTVVGTGTNTATVTVDGGTLDMTGKNIGATGALVVFNARSGTLRNLGTINGTAGLTKTTAGTLVLDTANAYTGATTVSAGVLSITDANALGTTANGTAVSPSGTLQLSNSITITGEALTLTASAAGDAILHSSAGSNVWAGPITVDTGSDASARVRILSAAGSQLLLSGPVNLSAGTQDFAIGGDGDGEISGQITGSQRLFKSSAGTGTWVLSNAGNAATFTGRISVGAGTLQVASEANLGATPGSAVANQLTLGGGATSGTLRTTADLSLSANRGVTLGASGGGFNENAGTTLTVDSIITGAGSLTKSGPGTLVLTAANDYAGVTVLANGTLRLGAPGVIPDTSALAITAGTFDLNGQAETIGGLSGGGIITNSAGGASTLTVDYSGGTDSIFSGQINNAGGVINVVKSGTGTLVFSGANTYAGSTTVNDGTLRLGAPGAVPATTALIVNGGTFDLNGNDQTVASLSGGGVITNSHLTGNATFTVNYNGGTATTFGGMITNGGGSGVLNLVKAGTGTLILGGANTYKGSTTINGGTLSIGASGNLGDASAVTNTVSIDNATLEVTGNVDLGANRAVTLGAGGATLKVASGNTLTVPAAVSGSGALTKTDAGTLVLGNSGNHYTGTTTVSAGTLQLGANDVIPDGAGRGGVIVNGTLDLNGHTEAINSLAGSGSVDNTAASTSAVLSIGSDDSSSTFSSTIANSGVGATLALTKVGSGTLTLGGTNTFAGGVTIQAGTVVVSTNANLGDNAGALSFGGTSTLALTDSFSTSRAVVLNAAGTLDVADTKTATLSGKISGIGGLTKSGSGTLVLTNANTTAPDRNSYGGGTSINAGTLVASLDQQLGDDAGAVSFGGNATLQTSGTFTSARPVAIGAGFTGTVDVSGPSTTLGGTISGATGTLRKAGAGELVLSNTGDNTYGGGTIIAAGTLTAAKSSHLGTGDLTFSGPGSFKAVDTFAISRSVNVNASSTFEVTSGKTLTLDSASSLHGSGQLIKSGAGTLVVGSSNQALYTGGVTVDAGEFVAANATGSATGDGDVTINAAGTLAGNGAISGHVNVSGSLAPGLSLGTLSTGALSLFDGATLKLEIETASLSGDRINITGDLSLSGVVTLALAEVGTDTVLNFGDRIILANYSGAWNGGKVTVPGFGEIPDWVDTNSLSSFTFHGNDYAIDYNFDADANNPSNPNSVALVVVPEPGAFASLAGSAAMLLGLQRFRRRKQA